MSCDNKLGIAVIGTGSIAQTVTDALSKSDDIRVISVASRDIKRAESFARRNRIANAFGSYDELIDSNDYDLVYISTINSTHFEIAHKCLEANRPVLVEKPICLNSKEVYELVKLSRDTGTFLAEAMPLRYCSNMKRVMDMLKQGDIGEVRLVVSNIGIDCWEVPRIRERHMGGGALYDLGIYGLTLADMIFAGQRGLIQSSCNMDNGVDSQNTVIINYDKAQSILFNSVKLQTKGSAVIFGERGRIFINKAYNAQRIAKYCGFRNIKIYKNTENHYVEELRACKEAILNGNIEPYEYKHDDMINIYEKMDEIRCAWIREKEL